MTATAPTSSPEELLADVDAVLFDLDGTLVLLDAPWASLREHLASFLEDDLLPTGPQRPCTETLRDLREAKRHDDVDRVLHHLREVELQGVRTARPLPRGLALYREAEVRGLPVAIVSNNHQDTVEAALRRFRLRGGAHHVAGLAATPHPKPRPDGLHRALEALEVPREGAIFVGNDWKDWEAGEAAGVTTVDVATYEAPPRG